MAPQRLINEGFEADVKLMVELVCPGVAKAQGSEPWLVVLSTHWRNVLEDMIATTEACGIEVVATGL